MQVLLVEDDIELAQVLRQGLKEEGIFLDTVSNSVEANQYMSIKEYDIFILDKSLPGLDGLSYCKSLRECGCETPVLILSSYADLESKLTGFENGADDYLAKPFQFPELIARLRALGKRKGHLQNHILSVKNISLNLMSREVIKDGERIELRNNEFNLLALLLRRKNQVVSKTEIFDLVWSSDDYLDPNILNVTMYNLRNKVERKNDKKLIITVRGIGYKIRESD